MDFEGKVLFATGGGSGIAAATARQFAAGGGRVAVVDLDARQGRGGRRRHRRRHRARRRRRRRDRRSLLRSRRRASALGRIDGVLNAAGHATFGPIEEWTLEDWHRMMAVHAGGTFLVCKHVLPMMREQGGGSIVNIASTAALTANNHNSPYGAAKGAIVAFSRQLAREAAPDVRVNAVAPGRVRTGMTEPLFARGGDGRGGRQATSAWPTCSSASPSRRARRPDLLPAVGRRQLHHRHAARRRRRRDGDLISSCPGVPATCCPRGSFAGHSPLPAVARR